MKNSLSLFFPLLIYSLNNQVEVGSQYKIIAWFIKIKGKKLNWWKNETTDLISVTLAEDNFFCVLHLSTR